MPDIPPVQPAVVREDSVSIFSEETKVGDMASPSTAYTIAKEIDDTSIKSVETDVNIPNGGLIAWLQVFSSFLVNFVVIGTMNVFGVYLRHYNKDLNLPSVYQVDSTAFAFIGSAASGFISLFGIITGRFSDKFGYKIISGSGAVCYLLALVIASFAESYAVLLLAQGVLFGLAAALCFYPSLAILSQWFDTKKGVAIGIAVSGSGVGGALLSPLTNVLIELHGYKFALRATGLVGGALLLLCTALYRPRVSPVATSFSGMGVYLKDNRFWRFWMSNMFNSFGYFVPFFFIMTYAKSHGHSSQNQSFILAVMNASSGIGRILLGSIADSAGYKKSLAFTLFIASASIFLIWPFAVEFWSLIVFSVVYGIFAGGYVALFPSAIVAVFGTKNIATLTGLIYSGCFFGNISGPTIFNLVATKSSVGFIPAMMTAGIALFIGASLILSLEYTEHRKKLEIKD